MSTRATSILKVLNIAKYMSYLKDNLDNTTNNIVSLYKSHYI